MKNQKGITLVELLIALLLSALIAGGLYKLSIGQSYVYSVQESVAEAQNASRAGMEIMFGDLRMAGYDKQGGGSNVKVNTAVSGTASKIKVEWEYNNDTIKAVEYYRDGNNLVRSIYMNGLIQNGSPEEVLNDVTGLSFTYTMSGTKITKADVRLTVSTRPLAIGTQDPKPLARTLNSTVMFRNVK